MSCHGAAPLGPVGAAFGCLNLDCVQRLRGFLASVRGKKYERPLHHFVSRLAEVVMGHCEFFSRVLARRGHGVIRRGLPLLH
jgi:hypothetical protein